MFGIPEIDATPTPEEVVEQLRALRERIGATRQLTAAQRRFLRDQARTSEPILHASINVIGATDNLSQAVGRPAEEVRRLSFESDRWTAVEDELRTFLSGVVGANLERRARVARLASQAYGIGTSLARDPEHATLRPYLAEIKRLKRIARSRRGLPQPDEQPDAAGGGTSDQRAVLTDET